MQSHIAICPSICKKGKFTAKEGFVRIGKRRLINAISIPQSLPIVHHVLLIDGILTFLQQFTIAITVTVFSQIVVHVSFVISISAIMVYQVGH